MPVKSHIPDLKFPSLLKQYPKLIRDKRTNKVLLAADCTYGIVVYQGTGTDKVGRILDCLAIEYYEDFNSKVILCNE